MTYVKICGLTTYDDAAAARDAGADLLGFIFYRKSPRHIAPQAAAEIVERLGINGHGPRIVGVFVNETVVTIRRVASTCRLDFFQLSGDEPPAVVEALNDKAFKALRPASVAEAEADAGWYAGLGVKEPALLLDANRPGFFGGTGERANWQAASRLARAYPILLAGGLTPENVADAVAQVRPWGVDVASGVEASPGKKDAKKVRAFIAEAKRGLIHPQPPPSPDANFSIRRGRGPGGE